MLNPNVIRRRMDELNLSQKEVARACGITQPHLSKVLSGKTKPGPKTETALEVWRNQDAAQPALVRLESLARSIAAAPPAKRMHVMHFLESLEALLKP